MPDLACPYCYDSFAEREILFRCAGRPGLDGTSCPRKRDEVLAGKMGRALALPPVFTGRGSRLRAQCPDCAVETNYRLCPRCHSQLPLHFGKVRSRLIALIGAKQSGKTVYMTVLIHELMNRVGARFGASVVGSDDDTRAMFDRDYERRIYREGALPGSTMSAGVTDGRRAPLVFRFTVERRRLLGRAGLDHSILSFFDTAGEDLTSQGSADLNARYVGSADGIILLLDPLQMRGARELARDGAGAGAEQGVDHPLTVLTRVTDLLHRTRRGRPGSRIAKPIAVAFTKLDTLWHQFPDGTALRRPAADAPRFDVGDSVAVHSYVQALLHDWDGAQVDTYLRHNYAKYRYFGLSALGDLPTPENRVNPMGVRPYRVQDPFLWLLNEFGTIEAAEG